MRGGPARGESSMRGGPPSMRGGPREPRPRKRCAALLEFASEQLQGSPHTVIDAAALNTEPLLTGLAICVHNGTVFYRESHHKHAWHGSSDRSYGALQVANLWLARTGYRGTRCWQHSGRDDQRLATSARPCLNESRVRQPTGQCVPGLPAMLWHWCARDDSCRRPGSKAAASSYPGGLFLWPEWDYEGTITQHQPPTRLFRREMARLSPPWASRPDARLRYRGSLNMGPRSARAAVLHCGNESASGEAAAFFRERTDFGAISWEAVSSSRRGDGLPESMRLEANLRHKHVLWLPGGADWSSSLNRFMALGSTLYLPGDIGHSHSLNALMLLERCNGKCAITYNLSAGTEWRRPGTQFGHDVCTSIRRAFLSHDEAEAERYAAGLSSFVERELSPDCVDEYVLSILKALPQTVRRPELLGTQLGPGGGRVGFRPFRCANFVRSNSILKREVGALEHAREWHGCKL